MSESLGAFDLIFLALLVLLGLWCSLLPTDRSVLGSYLRIFQAWWTLNITERQRALSLSSLLQSWGIEMEVTPRHDATAFWGMLSFAGARYGPRIAGQIRGREFLRLQG